MLSIATGELLLLSAVGGIIVGLAIPLIASSSKAPSRKPLKKDVLIQRVREVMQRPGVNSWYEKHLTGQPQENTITEAEQGFADGSLTFEEALSIAFLVGLQWNESFD